MFLLASHDVRVVHNTFRRNGELGLHIGDSNDNLVKGNLIERNQGIAVLIEGDRNQIRRNRIRHSIGNIIVAPGNGNVIANNRVSRSPRGTRSSGIAIEVGRGTMVNGNVIAHLRGPGISLGLENPPLGGTNNVIRRNLVKDTSGDGYAVAQKDDHSILRRNVAIGAKDDGFDIEGRRTKLTGNRAIRNGDLGIEAVRGVIDGGGNIARHNRDPRQCTHVPCN